VLALARDVVAEWDKDVDAWADSGSAQAVPASALAVGSGFRISVDAFARSRHAPIAAVT